MNKMTYEEFLKTVGVIRMLYGLTESRRFFEKNIAQFPQFNYDDVTQFGKNIIESKV